MRNIIDREQSTRRHNRYQNIAESVPYQVDFDRLMTHRGTSVSSATWDTVSGDLSISGAALASNKATANLSMTSAGKGLAKVTATQADGNTRVVYIGIKAIDPVSSTTDYN